MKAVMELLHDHRAAVVAEYASLESGESEMLPFLGFLDLLGIAGGSLLCTSGGLLAFSRGATLESRLVRSRVGTGGGGFRIRGISAFPRDGRLGLLGLVALALDIPAGGRSM